MRRFLKIAIANFVGAFGAIALAGFLNGISDIVDLALFAYLAAAIYGAGVAGATIGVEKVKDYLGSGYARKE